MKSKPSVFTIVTSIVGAWIFAALVIPKLIGSSGGGPSEERSNAIVLSNCLKAYEEDHHGQLPPFSEQGPLPEAFKDYSGSSISLTLYVWNENLSSSKFSDYQSPESIWLLYSVKKDRFGEHQVLFLNGDLKQAGDNMLDEIKARPIQLAKILNHP